VAIGAGQISGVKVEAGWWPYIVQTPAKPRTQSPLGKDEDSEAQAPATGSARVNTIALELQRRLCVLCFVLQNTFAETSDSSRRLRMCATPRFGKRE
jgi:hypothetical protein